jgi:succinate dehydrogenase / fumarate reductase cytochrome b subunit
MMEGLRYGGGIGQWSWLIHRVTGLGVLLFLIVHILDTFFVVLQPVWYDHTVAIYGGMITGLHPSVNGYYWWLRWAFRFGELGLIACVVFHSLNGLRVVLFDFWPPATNYQRPLFNIVLILFAAIMIPVSVVIFLPLTQTPTHWKMPVAESAP